MTAVAINSQNNQKIFNLEKYLVGGRMPKSGQAEVIMGAQLAELMEFSLGDYLILLFKDINDTFNKLDAEIVGLYDTPYPALNEDIFYLPLATAQNFLYLEGQVTENFNLSR